ncbi:hypothetical protein K504DRAFT_448740 [Pleomassaria siparia CBS 279.74]|uniref:Uncharacterized protein n=1 Tax=Pleomassaria siparia CBS 279.74 TaxID=1314801 RepID=A0A6G1JYT2_9PLEO|nr:hypothetical protein K504DRAFT_448740 [Pleomassaria siparia CBS 279.74]
MPATSFSLGIPTTPEQQPSKTSPRDSVESTGTQGAFVSYEDDDDSTPRPAPALLPLTRNWTSLQEHADSVRAVTAAGGSSTPRREDRREGFTWEVPKGDGISHQSWRSRGYPTTPPRPHLTKKVYDSQDDAFKGNVASTTDSEDFEPRELKRRTSTALSTPSSIGPGISRSNTESSSIGSIARGVMRHVPDIRMFDPEGNKARHAVAHGTKDVHEERPPRLNKLGRTRTFSFKPSLALAKGDTDGKPPKHVHRKDGSAVNIADLTPLKGGLKDRRKLAQAEAMKLTLPLEMPNLPPRRRMSIPHAQDIQGLAPPRSLSPKPSWIRDTAPSWEPMADPPPIILEHSSESLNLESRKHGHGLLPGSDPIQSSVPPNPNEKPVRFRKHFNRPHHKKGHSHTSDHSIASLGAFASDEIHTPPIVEPQSYIQDGQSGKRPRRWRWSGGWASSEAASGEELPRDDGRLKRHFSFSGLFRASKRTSSSTPPISPFTKPANMPFHRTQYSSHAYRNALALTNMPVPPRFVPPGLQRVPTPPPPVFDQKEEVKGKLADFVFEMQGDFGGMKRPKPSSESLGRVWDSDALLMSQYRNITPESSPSDESPQAASARMSPTVETAALKTPGLTLPSNPWAAAAAMIQTPGIYMGDNPWGSIPLPSPVTVVPAKSTIASAPDTQSPPSTADQSDWFRVPLNAKSEPDMSAALKEIEERAKYEWLTPEHLPNSPLCPLHAKYRGPTKGMCVFHGRREAYSGLPVDGESPRVRSMGEAWKRGYLAHRRRRTLSTSSP